MSVTQLAKVTDKIFIGQKKNILASAIFQKIGLFSKKKRFKKNNLFLDKDFYPLVDAISGPTISGSERRLFQFKIPKNLFNSNYNLRIETAVEDKGYYVNDININLNPENLKKIYQGEGFINKIQFSAVDK